MRPPETFLGQPIRSLQTMLWVIAQNDDSYHAVIPDGIYGPETVQAVSQFQRRHGLPVTGITDQATWEAVVAVYEPAYTEQAPAQSLNILLDSGQVIRKGEKNPNLYLVQGMLTVLSERYACIGRPSMNGLLDQVTADALSSFQFLCGLPMTGNLDRTTWKHLALQYPMATNPNTLP